MLESRHLLAAYAVNSDLDLGDSVVGDGLCDTENNPNVDPPIPPSGICTLRAAIQEANHTAAKDLISIQPLRIPVPTQLPTITSAVEIFPAGIGRVVLDGGENLIDGLIFTASGNRVSFLVMQRFWGSAILLDGGGDNLIQDSYIGVDVSGRAAMGNTTGISIRNSNDNVIKDSVISANGWGVRMIMSSGNTLIRNRIGTDADGRVALGNEQGVTLGPGSHSNRIGLPAPGEGNLISGNDDGIRVLGFDADNSDNTIEGNYIGTDVTGKMAIGNTAMGIFIEVASDTRIGGADPLAANVIAGNGADGVYVGHSASRTRIEGNRIGTDVSGNVALGNVHNGVSVRSAISTVIVRNVIAGSGSHGVDVDFDDTFGTRIEGNKIGTDSAGEIALGNAFQGVRVHTARSTEVLRNVIAGNGSDGVTVAFESASGTRIEGNRIGTDATGKKAIGNGGRGIYVAHSGNVSVIDNVVSSNKGHGIHLDSSRDATIQRNIVGTDISGSDGTLGNGGHGVFVDDSFKALVGGDNLTHLETPLAKGNLISGNAGDGVRLTGSSASEVRVQGNFIGTDMQGMTPIPNQGSGVTVDQAHSNSIGLRDRGDSRGAWNVISGNGKHGVHILGDRSQGNTIRGVHIGTDRTGQVVDTDGITLNGNDLGNGGNGVFFENSIANFIDGTKTRRDTVISGNRGHGVAIQGARATKNRVSHSYIGTNLGGTATLGNALNGVFVADGSDNVIGGTTVFQGNVIGGNGLNGVQITGAAARENLVQSNNVGINVAGKVATALGNAVNGVFIEDSPLNQVGGERGRNYVAGNGNHGVYLTGIAASANLIANNYIGVDSLGVSDPDGVPNSGDEFGNRGSGVEIMSGSRNQVGAAGMGNLISGNLNGVRILGAEAERNSVFANFIGTDGDGIEAVGRQSVGVEIEMAARTRVGDDEEGARNIISGNDIGVRIGEGATRTSVLGNYIGTNADGDAAIPNRWGIQILAANTTIGGMDELSRNIISGNTIGVRIEGNNNRFLGNYVGTDVAGAVAIGNEDTGIFIRGNNNRVESSLVSGNGMGIDVFEGTGNTIRASLVGTDKFGKKLLGNLGTGMVLSSARNAVISSTISANGGLGVHVAGDNTLVEGNRIGTDFDGDLALGNIKSGVLVDDVRGTRIVDNLVSANGNHGILIQGQQAQLNALEANRIGTTTNGDPLGNANAGVFLADGAKGNMVQLGGVNGVGNTIAFNRVGISMTSGEDNLIRQNSIYKNREIGIDLGDDGVTLNDAGDADAGPNGLLNYPELTAAVSSAGVTRVDGRLDVGGTAGYVVELYLNEACDPSGYGEGKTHLASQVVQTNATGSAIFNFSGLTVPPDAIFTATVSDPNGNTSEFSQCHEIGPPSGGTIEGRVYEDFNMDGVEQATEPGRGSWTVELVDEETGGVVETTQTRGIPPLCAPAPHFVDACLGDTDAYASVTRLQLDLDLDGKPETSLMLGGTATVHRGSPVDAILGSESLGDLGELDGHNDVISAELVSLSAGDEGYALRAGDGTVDLARSGALFSPGAIVEQSAAPTAADAFFDLFFELMQGDDVLVPEVPLRLEASLDQLYPTGLSPLKYRSDLGAPLPLLDTNNVVRGHLHEMVHTLSEPGTYAFTGVMPGDYLVRIASVPGWTQVSPNSRSHPVTIGGGESVSDRNFGVTKSLAGDVNDNGEVDFADFLVISTHFGLQPATRAQGDLDEDGEVGFADFLMLSNSFGAVLKQP